jgi:hypothetical protein
MTLIGSVRTGMQSARTGGEFLPPRSVTEEYVERIGRLNTALHRLEFLLRVFLVRAEGPNPVVDINKVKVGDKVPETALTDYATLGQLIKRYNIHADSKIAIQQDDVVLLRDSLAHARIYSMTEQPPFRLVRFAKPINGMAEVTSVVENLDAAWLEANRQLIDGAIKKVWAAIAVSVLAPSKQRL